MLKIQPLMFKRTPMHPTLHITRFGFFPNNILDVYLTFRSEKSEKAWKFFLEICSENSENSILKYSIRSEKTIKCSFRSEIFYPFYEILKIRFVLKMQKYSEKRPQNHVVTPTNPQNRVFGAASAVQTKRAFLVSAGLAGISVSTLPDISALVPTHSKWCF